MARVRYNSRMTGVQIPRDEIVNARAWAITKLSGFVVACIAVAGLLLLIGALLVGAKISIRTSPAATTFVSPPPSTRKQATRPSPTRTTTPRPVAQPVAPPVVQQQSGQALAQTPAATTVPQSPDDIWAQYLEQDP